MASRNTGLTECEDKRLFGNKKKIVLSSLCNVRQLLFENLRKYRGGKKSCSKVCELKVVNETLMKQNVEKDKKIRQLHKDVQQYEQKLLNLRNELSHAKCYSPDSCKQEGEATGVCHTGTECGDWEPVRDFTKLLQDETQQFQERITKMEANLKSSSESVRSLRKANVCLEEELRAVRRLCAALVQESRAADVRAQFKDDIIREMRRQLKQARTKLKEVSDTTSVKSNIAGGDNEGGSTYDSVTIACVRAQPRRKPDTSLRQEGECNQRHTDREGNDSAPSNMMGDNTPSDTTRACECDNIREGCFNDE